MSPVRIPGVRLFAAKISDAVFSPNFQVVHVFESSFALQKGSSRCAAHTFKLNLPKDKSPTFLVVHVDPRRRGTTPAAAGGIAEKGSDRPKRRCALKLASRISALL